MSTLCLVLPTTVGVGLGLTPPPPFVRARDCDQANGGGRIWGGVELLWVALSREEGERGDKEEPPRRGPGGSVVVVVPDGPFLWFGLGLGGCGGYHQGWPP